MWEASPRPAAAVHVMPLPDLTGRAGAADGRVKMELTLPAAVADLVAAGRAQVKIVQHPGRPPELHVIPMAGPESPADAWRRAPDEDDPAGAHVWAADDTAAFDERAAGSGSGGAAGGLWGDLPSPPPDDDFAQTAPCGGGGGGGGGGELLMHCHSLRRPPVPYAPGGGRGRDPASLHAGGRDEGADGDAGGDGPPTPPPGGGYGELGLGEDSDYSRHVAFDSEPLFAGRDRDPLLFGPGDDGGGGQQEELGPPALAVDLDLIHALSQVPR
jgi:hypothetical protein